MLKRHCSCDNKCRKSSHDIRENMQESCPKELNEYMCCPWPCCPWPRCTQVPADPEDSENLVDPESFKDLENNEDPEAPEDP